jgi:hypothetical protein
MQRMLAGEYQPDQPTHLNEGLLRADGVYPIKNGYAPINSFAAFANGTLAARCIGAVGYRYTGTPYLFAATTTNIYTYTSSGYVSVASGLAGTQALGVRFCAYNSFMLATNGVDVIKKFDPASPSAMTNLGGTPPVARYLTVVRGFVVAGYTGTNPLGIAWSDTGNPASWTAGGSSQAGSATLASGGDVTGLVGGEYGLIFQENRIVRMTYTADTAVWQFDEIVTDAGCFFPKSLATFGKISFFWSGKGFMACDGTSVEAIGDEKVDRTFQGLINRTYIDNMSAVVDPRRSLYIVAVPSSNPTSSVLLYNYAEKKWTTATITTELLFSALSLSTSLEELDALYGNLDLIPFSLDSNALRGGDPILLMFNASHGLGSLSGPNLAASLMDGRKELIPSQRARITSVKPLTDASAVTVAITGSASLSDAGVETEYTERQGGGAYKMRENYAFSQVRVSFAAGVSWSYYQGYDIGFASGGRA